MPYRHAAAVAAFAFGLSMALSGTAQAADIEAGAKVYRKCQACHVVDKPTNKVGPYLQGIFGRTAGTVEGFRYSKAMTQAGQDGLVWNEETMAEYLKNPRGYIKGNRMAFPGLRKDTDVDNVLAYIKENSQ